MKLNLLLPVLFISLSSFLYAQEEKEKQIEILEKEELTFRKTSIGAIGGGVFYFGEQASEMTLDYGLTLRNHVSPKFDISFSVHLGEIEYEDFLDATTTKKTTYSGFDLMFKLNLREAISNSEKPEKISPYIAGGGGLFLSKAAHYSMPGHVDFYLPISLGVDFNVSDRFIVGVNATGRLLFSDGWDNVKTSSSNDILFNPSISLHYVFAKKKTIRRKFVPTSIKYSENSAKEYEKYVKKSSNAEGYLVEAIDTTNYTPYVDALVEDDDTTSGLTGNAADNDFVFYSVQVASTPLQGVKLNGLTHDFEFNNKEIGKFNYCIGVFENYREASVVLKEVQPEVEKAFVIAIYRDKRLRSSEAKLMVKLGKTNVDTESAMKFYLKK